MADGLSFAPLFTQAVKRRVANTGYNITTDYPFFVEVFIEAAKRVPEYHTWAAAQEGTREVHRSRKDQWLDLCTDFELTHAPTDPLYEARALQALTHQTQGTRSVTSFAEVFKKRALVAASVAPTATLRSDAALEQLFFLGLDPRLQIYWTAYQRQNRPEQDPYRVSFRQAAELRLLVAQEATIAASLPAARPAASTPATTPVASPRMAIKSVTYSPELQARDPSPDSRVSGGLPAARQERPAGAPPPGRQERPRPTHHPWSPGESTCLLCGSYTHLAPKCPSEHDNAHSERMAKAWQEEQKAGATGRKQLIAHSPEALERIRAARRPAGTPGKGQRGGR